MIAASTSLSVNVNKVALLRNARALNIPNVLLIASLALEAGADGITIHPRPDERHIRAADVPALAALMKQWPGAEFNIEGNPLHQLMDFVRAVRPHQCTFVPDSVQQSTSDHGWDLARHAEQLHPLITEAQSLGVRVSLFVDAEPQAMQLAQQLGADRVELYTEPYAASFAAGDVQACLVRYRAAAEAALRVGLGVNAGHDLNLVNLRVFLQNVPGVQEVSIGHALIADALQFGIKQAVGMYLAEIRKAGQGAQ